jgi:hypothetical protein
MVAATWLKTPVVLPPGATFDDYLAMQLPEDEVQEMPVDLLSAPQKAQQQKQRLQQQQAAVGVGVGVASAPAGVSTPNPARAMPARWWLVSVELSALHVHRWQLCCSAATSLPALSTL